MCVPDYKILKSAKLDLHQIYLAKLRLGPNTCKWNPLNIRITTRTEVSRMFLWFGGSSINLWCSSEEPPLFVLMPWMKEAHMSHIAAAMSVFLQDLNKSWIKLDFLFCPLNSFKLVNILWFLCHSFETPLAFIKITSLFQSFTCVLV